MSYIDNKVTSFTFLHQSQQDRPAFPSSLAFKQAIDSQAQQLQTGLNGLIDDLETTGRQVVINGSFDIWQRGTTFTNPTSTYTADRWLVTVNADGGVLPANVVHSKQQLTTGDIPGASWYYRLNTDGAGSTYGANAEYALRQRIENGVRSLSGSGKKITVSFWARSTIPGKKIGARPALRYGTGGTPTGAEAITGTFFSLTTNWQLYTATFTLNTLVGKTFGTNNDDNIDVAFGYAWGSTFASFYGDSTVETFGGVGSIDIAKVQVNAGDTILPFKPLSFAEELGLCQRYFQQRSTNNVNALDLRPSMRIAPTITGTVSPFNYDAEM